MSDTVSFAELDGQHVELLPARTVLSVFSAQDTGGAGPGVLAPDQVTKVVLGLAGVPTPNAGPDGTSNEGRGGATNG